MIRAFGAIWLARCHRYRLAVGAVAVLVALASVFSFQQEPPGPIVDGLPRWLDNPPAVRKPPPPKQLLELDGELAARARVTERLPPPLIKRLPGVLCGLHESVHFGSAVSARGRFVAVGAPSDDTQGLDRGAVYVYKLHGEPAGGDWRQQTQVLAEEGESPAALAAGPRQPHFGRRVVLGDGVLAVLQGSNFHGGPPDDAPEAVYVFGSDNGWASWNEEARLETPAGGRGHGLAMAFLDPQTLLVGAPTADAVRAGGPLGAVYVYHRGPDRNRARGWARFGELSPPFDAGDAVSFGGTIATSGRIIAVSMGVVAPVDEPGDGPKPAILLYYRGQPDSPPENWIRLGAIPAPESANWTFGSVIAMDGTCLATSHRSLGGTPAQGGSLLYVYRSPREDAPADEWELEGVLPAPAGRPRHVFGHPIVLEGDVLASGSRQAWDSGTEIGSVAVYRRTRAGNWEFGDELAVDPYYLPNGLGYVIELRNGVLFMAASDPYRQHGPGSVFWWMPPWR